MDDIMELHRHDVHELLRSSSLSGELPVLGNIGHFRSNDVLLEGRNEANFWGNESNVESNYSSTGRCGFIPGSCRWFGWSLKDHFSPVFFVLNVGISKQGYVIESGVKLLEDLKLLKLVCVSSFTVAFELFKS